MMNQNMELAFGYKVAIQTHSLFLALGQKSQSTIMYYIWQSI